jgi:mRNA interferase MazF
MVMRRGEVWWAELPPPIGRRPVLLLSRDTAYAVRTSLTVAVVTRTIRDIPTEVLLDEKDEMPVRCVINLDDINTIRKASIKERITMLTPEKILAVRRAIVFALDLRS